MSIDTKVSYDVQASVTDYLRKQKQVKAPLKWAIKSRSCYNRISLYYRCSSRFTG